MKTISVLLNLAVWLAAFYSLLWIFGCGSGCGAVPPQPDPVPVVENCTTACANWKAFGMLEGEPTGEGVPCIDWCEIADQIPLFHERVVCVSRAKDQAQALACE